MQFVDSKSFVRVTISWAIIHFVLQGLPSSQP